MFDDTIAAIATPLGEGGLAVVRISGAEAFAIADKIFLPVGKNSVKAVHRNFAHNSFRKNCPRLEK